MNKTFITLVAILILSACNSALQSPTPTPDREALIPPEQTKITPERDIYPPVSECNEYEDPVPLPHPVNTAGAEDSAFITPDGKTLYLWFTPDVKKPVEEQVTDGVTGIYVSQRVNDGWSRPQRVMLQDEGKLALDGCAFVSGDVMWFCTAREGYTGLHWFTAEFEDGVWGNWRLADFDPEYEVGELHITTDGRELYFHSSRPGSLGEFDIWVSDNYAWEWLTPQNVEIVNSPASDGWPFVTQDGLELWFTRLEGSPVLYRSLKVGDQWSPPVKMFSNFAGEPSLDIDGNVYFTHHFYKDGVMLEADIYVARPK